MVEDLAGLGKIAEAAERATRELRQLLSDLAQDFLGPTVKEAGKYLGDRARFHRMISTVRAAQRAKEQIAASGIVQRPVSLKILVPALEGASLEEEDDLISRWAGLLATAATTGEAIPAFADILRQLAPEEARMLDFIHANAKELPAMDAAKGVEKEDLQKASGLSKEDFLIRIQNLHRLELVVQLTLYGPDGMRGSRGWGGEGHVGLTALGDAFVRACHGPGKKVMGPSTSA